MRYWQVSHWRRRATRTACTAAEGFEQIEIAIDSLIFIPTPNQAVDPLLFGDLLEEAAAILSRNAGSRLSRKEVAASAAPA